MKLLKSVFDETFATCLRGDETTMAPTEKRRRKECWMPIKTSQLRKLTRKVCLMLERFCMFPVFLQHKLTEGKRAFFSPSSNNKCRLCDEEKGFSLQEASTTANNWLCFTLVPSASMWV
jgi:hypothetical protein